MKELTVAIGGLGAIGLELAKRLNAGIPGLKLVAVSARGRQAAAKRLESFRHRGAGGGCGRARGSRRDRGRMPAGGAIPRHRRTRDRARAYLHAFERRCADREFRPGRAREENRRAHYRADRRAFGIGRGARGSRRQNPFGDDGVAQAAPGLEGAPYLAEHKISLAGLTAPLKVFAGSARDGAKGFPANVNVAAALSLAGIGPDRTRLEIWADPAIDRNIHRIEVEADSACFSMTIENVPSENPKTGRITALSAIACLRGLVAPLKIGS